MHKSRLGTVIIDSSTDNLAQEADFWSAALGGKTLQHDNEDRYIRLQSNPADPLVILQKVDHPRWIHIPSTCRAEFIRPIESIHRKFGRINSALQF